MPLTKEKMREYMRERRKKVSKEGIPEGGVVATSVTYIDEEGAERFRMNQGNVKGDYSFPEKAPQGIPQKEWDYAIERACRAKRYAAMFPGQVRPSEEVFQDVMWQWENEVRGRYGDSVGGSLSGTRP